METVIVAPHPDDEIIGCSQVLETSTPIIIYDGDTPSDRREEAKKLKEHTEVKIQLFQKSIPPNFMSNDCLLYFPDPYFETHPLHRKWGAIGEQIARDGFKVVFYNTNMTAPYIHEVPNPAGKESLLNTVYDSQRDLWLYEKKYVLFEGYCHWHFGLPEES